MNVADLGLSELCPRAVEAAAEYLVRQSTHRALSQAEADLAMATRITDRDAKKALRFLIKVGFAAPSDSIQCSESVWVGENSRATPATALAERCLSFAEQHGILRGFAPALRYEQQAGLLYLNPIVVPWQYRGLRDLLKSLGALERNAKRPNRWIITKGYSSHFLRSAERITPESVIGSAMMSPSNLEDVRSRRSMLGHEAELWALKYERRRLAGHPFVDRVDHIASYNVAAGYDIASFSGPASLVFDRFIEVKSFSGCPTFHWSKEEIAVAKRLESHYVLFLVDRSLMDDDYEPIEIANPYDYFFEHPTGYWRYEPTEYRFDLVQ